MSRPQFRPETFNFRNATEFGTIHAGSPLVTSAGPIGSAIFGSDPNVNVTNSLRPAGAILPRGWYCGEFNPVRDPRKTCNFVC